MTPAQYKALMPGDTVIENGHRVYKIDRYVPPTESGLSFSGFLLRSDDPSLGLRVMWEDELERWSVVLAPGTRVVWECREGVVVCPWEAHPSTHCVVCFDEPEPVRFHECRGKTPDHRGYWLRYDSLTVIGPSPHVDLKAQLQAIWEPLL
jgi:hypothetical protein